MNIKQINIFFPKNIYGLLISLSFQNSKKNIIFLNNNLFYLDKFLSKYLSKTYALKFTHIKNYKQIISNVKKIIKHNINSEINFFHKEDFKRLRDLKNEKINYFFLENGIGNYYNFVTTKIASRYVDLIRNTNRSNFKFYAGIYAQLNNSIFIYGHSVAPKVSLKISKIIKDLFLFHLKQYDYFKVLNKVILEKNRVILVNFPDFLNFKEIEIFLHKLNTEKIFRNKFCLIKLHPKENKKSKYLNLIKKFFNHSNSEYLILDEKFENTPFELIVPFSKNIILYSSISNFPLASSLLFSNKIYIYLHAKNKKKFEYQNELKKKSYSFYKKNFPKINFI
jgi:hypothetical protein